MRRALLLPLLALVPCAAAGEPPVAVAVAAERAAPGEAVTLYATRSSDPDGDTLSFMWTQVSGPATVAIADERSAMAHIVAPAEEGAYEFAVRVADASASARATLTLRVDRGLVARWSFAEGAADETGQRHGALHGGATVVDDAQRGRVLALDGTGHVAIGGAPLALSTAWDTATLRITAAKGRQGLTTDDRHFYWAEDHDPGDSTIHRLTLDGTEAGAFPGPQHGSTGDWHAAAGTLLFAGSVPAQLWELGIDGDRRRTWDLSAVDHGRGGMACWRSGEDVYLRTATKDYVFAIRELRLGADGTVVQGRRWGFPRSLGPGQGMDHHDGRAYYLTDFAKSSSPIKAVFRFALDPASEEVGIDRVWWFRHDTESEGMTFDAADRRLMWGDRHHRIFDCDFPRAVPKGLTLSAWIKQDSLATPTTILSKGSLTDDREHVRLALNVGRPGRVSFSMAGVQGHLGLGLNDALVAGRWQHVAATWDGVWMRLWIDGVAKGRLLNVGPLVDTSAGVTIGCDIDAGQHAGHFTGRLDEVRIHDRALTASEVAACMAMP